MLKIHYRGTNGITNSCAMGERQLDAAIYVLFSIFPGAFRGRWFVFVCGLINF